MQIIVATDGSKASLVAAQQFKSFADPSKIDEVVVVAVVSPLAVVPFDNELSVGPSPAAPTMRSTSASNRRHVPPPLR